MADSGLDDHSANLGASIQRPLSSEQLLQRALNAGGIGLWDYDPRARVLHGSAAIETNDPRLRDVRLSIEEFIALIRPDHQVRVVQALEGAAETGEPAFTSYEVTRPDGAVRWIHTHLVPERDEAGAVVRVIAVTRDVTDLQESLAAQEKLLAEVITSRDLAEQTVRARNNFISSTVHDLRTPMTSIRGRTQLLLRRLRNVAMADEDRAAVVEGLSQIEAGISRMNDLLGDLQDAAFLQIGHPLELHPRSTQLGDLFEEAIAEIQPLYPTHRFALTLERDVPALSLDPVRFRRVATNLLTNAAKYSQPGRTVTVAITADEEAVTVRVIDEGIGIPAPERDRIFERFYRAANAPGMDTGSGIGLAGVRQVVRQHGGEVSVESEEGSGSTFIIRLPHRADG